MSKKPDLHFSDGWIPAARQMHSPNSNPRPEGALVELIVIHNISLPPGNYGGGFIEALFTNQLDPHAHPYFQTLIGLQVSAHFLVRRTGELLQFVSTEDRAWHAGQSRWCGRENCNDFSLGIELEGTDDDLYTDAQYDQLKGLIEALWCCYPTLSPEAIVGHCDIAPGRKTDPGPAFDWQRLAKDLGATLARPGSK